MLFNSSEFLYFLAIVFSFYWLIAVRNIRGRNFFLLVASYFFYSWWNWKFLSLLLLSTVIDFLFGKIIFSSESKAKKKFFLIASVCINLGILGFFKYYNFFAQSFQDFFAMFGLEIHPYFLRFALPVGISFYTFHGMSYVFDIYNGKTKPTKNFIDYALFVCFFPLLVAGPIERATHLLPQITKKITFQRSQFTAGVKMIIWGFFKKIVIADSVAPVVNNIFDNHEQYSGMTLAYGAVLFAIQIYGDFSGYTDIALGTAKLFGFELLTNFRFPYFSRNIGEFWKRWHISLSSWFRDYMYIPLGGSRNGKLTTVRNTFIIFLVSGFWHGASWTFVVWGFYHALLFIPLLFLQGQAKPSSGLVSNKYSLDLKGGLKILLTFSLVTIGWVFFRAPDISTAASYILGMFTRMGSSIHPDVVYTLDLVMMAVFVMYEYVLYKEKSIQPFLSFFFYVLISIFIIGAALETTGSNEFIYFQF